MKYKELIEKLENMDKTEFADYIYDNCWNPINTEDGVYAELYGIPFEIRFYNDDLVEYFNLEDEYNKVQDDKEELDYFIQDLSDKYHLNDDEVDKYFAGEKKDEIIEELKYQIEYELDKDLEDEIEKK